MIHILILLNILSWGFINQIQTEKSEANIIASIQDSGCNVNKRRGDK